jgi:hypothetical protein
MVVVVGFFILSLLLVQIFCSLLLLSFLYSERGVGRAAERGVALV